MNCSPWTSTLQTQTHQKLSSAINYLCLQYVLQIETMPTLTGIYHPVERSTAVQNKGISWKLNYECENSSKCMLISVFRTGSPCSTFFNHELPRGNIFNRGWSYIFRMLIVYTVEIHIGLMIKSPLGGAKVGFPIILYTNSSNWNSRNFKSKFSA